MTRLLFAILPAFAAMALSAQDMTAEAIASLESGVICPPPTVGTAPAPGTVAGTTHLIDENPPFVSLGNRVPAVLGIGFGVKAMAVDPAGLSDVTMTVTHPPMGDGKATSQSFFTRVGGGDPSLTFYQFDFDYELLIGTWTMTATKDGVTLYETQFDVVPPRLVPELAAICGFEQLLS